MAEFLGQTKDTIETDQNSGFNAMGKPVPYYRREAGYRHCKDMGLGSDESFAAVNGMSEALERDNPHGALGAAMKYLDLTGAYRLMAVLLTATVKES